VSHESLFFQSAALSPTNQQLFPPYEDFEASETNDLVMMSPCGNALMSFISIRLLTGMALYRAYLRV